MLPNEWIVEDSQTNLLATATKSGAAGKRHIINHVIASYVDATITGLLQIKKGTDVVLEHYVHGADVLPVEIRGDAAEDVSAELAAGGVGKVGKVQICGTTDG